MLVFDKMWSEMSTKELAQEEINLVDNVNFAQDELKKKYDEFVSFWKKHGLTKANDKYKKKLKSLASARDAYKDNLKKFKSLYIGQLEMYYYS